MTQGIKGNFIRNKMALILSNLVAPMEWRYDILSNVGLFLLIFAIIFVCNHIQHLFEHLMTMHLK